MFLLFNIIIALVLGFVAGFIGLGGKSNLLSTLYTLAILLPAIGVAIRRLHDTGRSGWWLLLCLIPFLGALVILFFMIQDSQPGENQYGPNPKLAAA